MRNNVATKVIGIRIIKIKTDGGVIRTLIDVRYMLDLKKTLYLLVPLMH